MKSVNNFMWYFRRLTRIVTDDFDLEWVFQCKPNLSDLIGYIFYISVNLWDRATPLLTLLVYFFERESTDPWKETKRLIEEEASWLKYVEKMDETKSPWLVNTATADVLFPRDRAELKVSDALANIFADSLDTFESVADADILWVKFVMI